MKRLRAQTLAFRWRRWWNAVLNVMYPDDISTCLLCHRPMQELPPLARDLQDTTTNRAHTEIRGVCPFCLQDSMNISNGMRVRSLRIDSASIPVITAMPYYGLMRNAIRQWKYDGAVDLTTWFASWVQGAYGSFLQKYPAERWPVCRIDLVAPVPTSADRLHKRGYDHVQLLAESLGPSLNLPVVQALVRQRPDSPLFTQSQTAKSAIERRQSLRGVYRVEDKQLVRGQRVLLVDDVVTTGATMHTCASALLSAGASSVVCLAIADVQ